MNQGEGKSQNSVAVIGSGIAGLSAAFILSQRKDFHVTLFEREATLGMDSQSVDTVLNGSPFRLDTPPRAFSISYYPNLYSMYEMAGVNVEEFNWAWSCTVLGERRAFWRVGERRLLGFRIPEFKGFGALKRLFSTKTFRIVSSGVRFHRDIKEDYEKHPENYQGLNLREYLKKGGYSEEFIMEALLPLVSMICTCKYNTCMDYPVELIMEYFLNNSSYSQYHTKYGSCDAVAKLSAKCEVKLACPVDSVKRADGRRGAEVTWDGGRSKACFDKVIVATPANVSLRILHKESFSQREIDALNEFRYESSVVVIHKDRKLMPPDPRDWSPQNVIIPRDKSETMFTMWCASASDHLVDDEDSEAPLLQTWNPIIDPEPSKLIKKITFERPVISLRTLGAMQVLDAMQGKGGVYFCGSYAMRHVPLQENGVLSALQVCKKMGIECPWTHLVSKNIIKNQALVDENERARKKKLQRFSMLVVVALATAVRYSRVVVS
eukprot:g4614.t1